MRYFKNKYWIYEVTDDLSKWRYIYNLETKKHLKFPCHITRPGVWKDNIELTEQEVFIEML